MRAQPQVRPAWVGVGVLLGGVHDTLGIIPGTEKRKKNYKE